MNNRTDWLNIDFLEHLNIISCDVCIAYLPYYKTLFYILFYCNALTQDKLYCYISKHLKTFKSIDLPLMILRFLVAMTHHTVEPISQFSKKGHI